MVLTEFINKESGNEIIKVLESKGYQTQASNLDGGYGSLIASNMNFITVNSEDRWLEVYLSELDLYVLGVYIPNQPGKIKNDFWSKILEYSLKNQDKNILITGDFNSCTREDSSNHNEYNPLDLKKLEESGYIDLWKHGHRDEGERFTWFYHDGTGFRLDYFLASPGLYSKLNGFKVSHDKGVRENGISDHSAILLDLI
ncbi:MAG: endonuclease/exonuclease/phosphatase family protein [Methanobacterium sp.]|nr:endonuclease/exonuclease/phosphatase family protein [Euryarchaeota archaeon]MBV1729423.1 endonuclease/exonuclease/phosphatase family protein [Methanobacterium sp.]MBV1766849.1 endonuclease/exonuclease/phosphatase family protein [Methanobacterium sp.]